MKKLGCLPFLACLLLIMGWFFPVSVFASETSIHFFSLTPQDPYVDTGLDLREGDVVTIFKDGNSTISIPGSNYFWLGTHGDPSCSAGADFTLPGVNCWSLIARIGDGEPFFASSNVVGQGYAVNVSSPGRLYLGINHAPQLTGFGGWRLRVIKNFDPPPPPPEPFLELPWDYEGNGDDFATAATAINSWFDHEYPLLSVGSISNLDPLLLVNYLGSKTADKYSSHDGYDYGRAAKTKNGAQIFAAADGCATYNFNGAGGHQILIDHGNYYQTRYYHLQAKELVTKSSTNCVPVQQGQQIGLVGFSGNVSPAGEPGSHLHFMVVEDKNRDGSFDDNIPDGVTDPFGWQSPDPDPWQNYEFIYRKTKRIGNDSHYLWLHQLPNLDNSLDSNRQVFEIEEYSLDFQTDSTDEKLSLSFTQSPSFFISETVRSVLPGLKAFAKNLFGDPITTFLKPFTLTIDYSEVDLSRYKPETLRIYSSQDGQTWMPEETILDLIHKTATGVIDHFSFFTLAAELKDTVAPTTTISIDQEPVVDSLFAEPVTISLEVDDGPDGSGIDYIGYQINGGVWQVYEQPFTLSENGVYQVRYYSIDLEENIESVQTYDLEIDTNYVILPELEMVFDLESLDVSITASPSGAVEVKDLAGNRQEIVLTSESGHTLTVWVKKTGSSRSVNYKLEAIRYGNGPKITLNKTYYKIRYAKSRAGVLRTLVQTFKREDSNVVLNYRVGSNETKMTIKSSGQKTQRQVVEGVGLLKLFTDQGSVSYYY